MPGSPSSTESAQTRRQGLEEVQLVPRLDWRSSLRAVLDRQPEAGTDICSEAQVQGNLQHRAAVQRQQEAAGAAAQQLHLLRLWQPAGPPARHLAPACRCWSGARWAAPAQSCGPSARSQRTATTPSCGCAGPAQLPAFICPPLSAARLPRAQAGFLRALHTWSLCHLQRPRPTAACQLVPATHPCTLGTCLRCRLTAACAGSSGGRWPAGACSCQLPCAA